MTKEKYGKECKICSRPFTVFRWCPGARMRFKKTEVCQTCSKLKNVCQTCLLDLQYGLPVQVRDAALKVKDDLPRSDVNREYYIQKIDAELATNPDGSAVMPAGSVGKVASQKSELLTKLARNTPYYKRNRAHICSFWVKGECKRGEECPYRHDRPSDPDDPLSQQNIKDRYYGVNDPVANKLMDRASALPRLEPPEDPLITTLYVGGLEDLTSTSAEGPITENDIRNNFYQYGEIRSISMASKQACAFVQFTKRSAAEVAAQKTFNKMIVKGRKLTIRWGKSQGKMHEYNHGASAAQGGPNDPGLPTSLPLPPEELKNNFFNFSPPETKGFDEGAGPSKPQTPIGTVPFFYPRGGTAVSRPPGPPPGGPPPPPLNLPGPRIHYPSQNPSRMGATQDHHP